MNNKKSVFITGAGRGIGKATALAFAKQGYQIGIVCRNHINELKDTKKACEELGATCICYQGNTADHDFINDCAKDFIAHFSSIDVLVNNAGISYVGLLTDLSPEEWQEIVSINLSSLYHTCHAFVPYMVHEKHGHIINISSVWGNVGASCEVAYSATKGGVNSFTKALAKELAPSNISVNAIACGAIDTSMNAFLSEEDRKALCEEIPAGRFGTPEETADFICSLAYTSTYLTGQIIGFDGGWC